PDVLLLVGDISRTRAISRCSDFLLGAIRQYRRFGPCGEGARWKLNPRKVQPTFAGFDFVDTRFVSVDFQSQPLLDLLSYKALQPRSDLPAQEDKVVCVPDQFDFRPLHRSIFAINRPIKPVERTPASKISDSL